MEWETLRIRDAIELVKEWVLIENEERIREGLKK